MVVSAATGEVMTMDGDSNFIAELNASEHIQAYCSMQPKDDKEKALLYNAMNSPEFRLSDKIGETIALTDVFCEVVNCKNPDTGEFKKCPRIVLLDKDHKGYQCVSVGIFGAVKKLFQSFGLPTWTTPINIKVRTITKGTNKILTLEVVTK